MGFFIAYPSNRCSECSPTVQETLSDLTLSIHDSGMNNVSLSSHG